MPGIAELSAETRDESLRRDLDARLADLKGPLEAFQRAHGQAEAHLPEASFGPLRELEELYEQLATTQMHLAITAANPELAPAHMAISIQDYLKTLRDVDSQLSASTRSATPIGCHEGSVSAEVARSSSRAAITDADDSARCATRQRCALRRASVGRQARTGSP